MDFSEEDEATNPTKPGRGFDDIPDMREMDADDEPNTWRRK